jgi:hypothetical protein
MAQRFRSNPTRRALRHRCSPLLALAKHGARVPGECLWKLRMARKLLWAGVIQAGWTYVHRGKVPCDTLPVVREEHDAPA